MSESDTNKKLLKMSRLAALVCTAAAFLAACGSGGQDEPVVAAPAPPAMSTSLGLVELDISGIGTARPTSEMRWDQTAARKRALSATAAGVTSIPAGLDIQFQSASSIDVGTRLTGGVRYISATYKVRNAQACSTPGSCTPYAVQRNNLTFLAAVTTTSINSSGVSRFTLFDGTAAPAALAPQLVPTHGMNATATTVDAQRASMQIYRDTELPAVDPAATDLLPYGFVVNNVNGGRTLAANPLPNQFDGIVTLAFKLPLQPLASDDPFKVTIRFQVVEDSNTRVTQSTEETPASVKARADALNVTDVAVLCNGASPVPDANPICGARVAGTLSNPSNFIATPPTAPGAPVVLLAPVNLLNVAPTADIVIGTSEAMNVPTDATLVVQGSQSGRRKLFGAYSGLSSAGTASRPNQLVFKLGPGDKPFFRGEQVSFTATAANTSLAGGAALAKYVGSFVVAGSSAYVAGPWPSVRGNGGFYAPPPPPDVGPPPMNAYNAVFATGENFGNARSVAFGDLDGDGNLDLVSVSTGPLGRVVVLMGQGAGAFGPPSDFSVGQDSYPKSVALGDLNGDGKLDIVVAVEGGVALMLGDGAGGFGPATTYSTNGSIPRKVLLGDFNADGRLDVAVNGFFNNGGAISILLGDGNGALGASTAYPAGGDADAFAVGDVDGDGRLDVVAIHTGANLMSVLLGQGSGLGPATTNPVLDQPFDLALGDVNGDGKLDMVVSTPMSSGTPNPPDPFNPNPVNPPGQSYGSAVYLGTGLGGFSFRNKFGFGVSSQAITLADMNGDSKLDIVMRDTINGRGMVVEFGNGLGDFGVQVSSTMFGQFPYQDLSGAPAGWTLGDLNGDGLLDLVVFIDTGEGRILFGS